MSFAQGLIVGIILGLANGLWLAVWITAPRQNGTSAKTARD